ncbi:hypothetical protein QYE76_013242 [Lolium multiflorum]|uniref:Transposase (putative) gypsy type domain-containing protein n=1 Tax=Lolium multiflorum TaxID=4521 RepID=A0AAD8X5Q1_LOLMU|nr:hypothetical protein QYE76_013242 [Lolium multiflorum]
MAAQDLGNTEWERSKISAQDINLLKKLGLSKKKDALRFPSEESYPTPPIGYRVSFVDHLIHGLFVPIHDFLRGLLFVYGLQLHHLTPNSILHVSIFITLCECFLGVHPNWALCKRIFFLRRNGSHNIAYNIGGVVICVRPDVEYFDVKFSDSVQGWRKRWLYIREESADSLEHNIPPFNGNEKILRRRSWDAEATDEEKSATGALMTCIHELQNTRGQELSGIQITTYFLRIRVQPLQARKNPLWMYAGDKDVDRLSIDLSVKDLEKLVRKISSLSKKDAIPTTCRVVPYSGTTPSPSGEEEEEEEEEEEPAANVTAPMSMSHTLALSETHCTAEETSTPHPDLQRSTPATSPRASSPKRARIELEALLAADKHAEDLAGKLKASEEAREKAENDASCIEGLRKRLHEAETDLSDKITQHVAREGNIASRLESLNRRFVRKMSQDFVLQKPEDDRLLDALSLLEIHADLVRRSIFDAKAAFPRLFPYFFPKKKEPDTFAALAKSFVPQEDLGLSLRQENLKIGVEGTITLVVESQQNVDWAKVGAATKLKQDKWPSLIRAAKPHSKKILAFLGYKPTPSSSSAKPEVK